MTGLPVPALAEVLADRVVALEAELEIQRAARLAAEQRVAELEELEELEEQLGQLRHEAAAARRPVGLTPRAGGDPAPDLPVPAITQMMAGQVVQLERELAATKRQLQVQRALLDSATRSRTAAHVQRLMGDEARLLLTALLAPDPPALPPDPEPYQEPEATP